MPCEGVGAAAQAVTSKAQACLCQLPDRQLKTDRNSIHDLETSADARAVVDAAVRRLRLRLRLEFAAARV